MFYIYYTLGLLRAKSLKFSHLCTKIVGVIQCMVSAPNFFIAFFMFQGFLSIELILVIFSLFLAILLLGTDHTICFRSVRTHKKYDKRIARDLKMLNKFPHCVCSALITLIQTDERAGRPMYLPFS